MEGWKLIKQGAESKIYLATYLNKNVLVKERFSKLYRLKHLDDMINKQRMRAEVKALSKALNIGLKVPAVYHVDTNTKCIYMEFIENAQTLKDLLIALEASNHTFALNKILNSFGEIIARLHNNGIIHGDLTTSNFLFQSINEEIDNQSNVELITIDFGLSHSFAVMPSDSNSILEDKAVDLYVMERAFLSTHPSLQHLLNDVIIKAYFEEVDKMSKDNTSSKRILKKLEEVQSRGRKRTMIG